MFTNGFDNKMDAVLTNTTSTLVSKQVEVTQLKDDAWFKLTNNEAIRPFFMNIVSDSNHWMFISSNGGLTAGRKNNSYSLFPYYTDDKITESFDTTGSKTILRVYSKNKWDIWEPFSERYTDKFKLTRNLYKNFFGNKIMFEEINHDLDLTFRYQWNSSNLFGFVRKSELINYSESDVQIQMVDGIQNILPYGVEPEIQTQSSNLVDAYKRSELLKETGLGIYALSAIIVDKAEPSEALKANLAWSLGLENPNYLLSSLQLSAFRNCQPIYEENEIKGERGAYFINQDFILSGGASKEWKIVANVNQNHSQVIELNHRIKNENDLDALIESDIKKGSENLKTLIAGADGLRLTADPLKDARHFSNVMFNIMRGGTIDKNYKLEKRDLFAYLENASKEVYSRYIMHLEQLDDECERNELLEVVRSANDPDLTRICREYLPLKFSRRHGDPSRPWNYFTINTHCETDGSKILDYEGNWRDIFQNWEALVHSYPGYVDGMIFKFLNASTFDGYNPYRITKGGFDWETIEHDNPWSYIGYWGDHQIIYLLKLLEFYQMHQSDQLTGLFNEPLFVYANVPYRIKPYTDIVENPKSTILFNENLDLTIRKKVKAEGHDGALLKNSRGNIHRVTFLEKILAAVLSKVSNLIPEGGIWMNTQRPEWNDANNALVGNGVSMVTLYYLRRFLHFLESVLEDAKLEKVEVSVELINQFDKTVKVLNDHVQLLNTEISDKKRKKITDALGKAGSVYRDEIYNHGFSGRKESVQITSIREFTDITLRYLDHSIKANKRADNLFHSYNIMSYSKDGITVSHLSEMLEGQVAILSSGYLNPEESLKVIKSLRNSALYREDQNSYILYPNKDLPRFLEKNIVSKKAVFRSELLKTLVDDGNHDIISVDIKGGFHFNGKFRNSSDLNKALDELEQNGYKKLVKNDRSILLEIFEEVFNHKAFTGRSGTFFAYEGLGSIYWHMVSKLHLAVSEVCIKAFDKDIADSIRQDLADHFYEIGEGIGIHKSPKLYGAFPTDAYSHTPSHRGAQQPGMTGQVKEDILTSINEFGIVVYDGVLHFNPVLLRQSEFISDGSNFEFIYADSDRESIEVNEDELCVSYCQVPITYRFGVDECIDISFKSGESQHIKGLTLSREVSKKLFSRDGEIKKITVSLQKKRLRSRLEKVKQNMNYDS